MDNSNPLSLAFLEQKPGAAASVLQEFSAERLAEFLSEVPIDILIPVIENMAAWPAARSLAEIPPHLSAAVLRKLPDAKAETLLRLIGSDRYQAIIKKMPAAVARKLYHKLAYPISTVGAWMDTAIPSFTGTTTVAHCLEQVRQNKSHLGGIVMVINDKRELSGVVDIEQILISDKSEALNRLMDKSVTAISSRATLWEVEHHDGWIHFPTLPVTDLDGHVLGALTHSALRTGTAKAVYRERPSKYSLLTHMTRAYFVALGGMMHVVTGVDSSATEQRITPAHGGEKAPAETESWERHYE